MLDMHLAELFWLQHASFPYKSALAAMPSIFCGYPEQLQERAERMAQRQAQEYLAMGRDVPPWRRCDALKRRWQPAMYNDTLVLPRPARQQQQQQQQHPCSALASAQLSGNAASTSCSPAPSSCYPTSFPSSCSSLPPSADDGSGDDCRHSDLDLLPACINYPSPAVSLYGFKLSKAATAATSSSPPATSTTSSSPPACTSPLPPPPRSLLAARRSSGLLASTLSRAAAAAAAAGAGAPKAHSATRSARSSADLSSTPTLSAIPALSPTDRLLPAMFKVSFW